MNKLKKLFCFHLCKWILKFSREDNILDIYNVHCKWCDKIVISGIPKINLERYTDYYRAIEAFNPMAIEQERKVLH